MDACIRYPRVRGEFATIAKVAEGFSLARFGDGELKMAHGAGYSRQDGSPALAKELRGILAAPPKRCLVGIPTMDLQGPKSLNWHRHRDRFTPLLSRRVKYFSAFVSRPDSAPWIETKDYCLAVQNIWAGRRVAVVCERTGSMLRAVLLAAPDALHIRCPYRGAWDVIDELEARAMAHAPDVVIAAAGPAATCLAARLARKGVQCVDLGSCGQFLLRHLA